MNQPARKPVASAGDSNPIADVLRRLGLARRKEDQDFPTALPEHRVARLGSPKGNYQQTPHGAIEALMEPDNHEHVRVYGWSLRGAFGYALQSHSTNKRNGVIRYHGRCVMKMERGKKVPATQADCARDLKIGTIIDERTGRRSINNVNRAIDRLVELGWIRRRFHRQSGQVLLFCYVRPRRAPLGNREDLSPEIPFPVCGSITVTYRPPECKWKIRFDTPGDLSPESRTALGDLIAEMIGEYRSRIEPLLRTETGRSVLRPESEELSGLRAPLKEERKGKEQLQQTSASSTHSRGRKPHAPDADDDVRSNPSQNGRAKAKTTAEAWPLTLSRLREMFPTAGEDFVRQLVTTARHIRAHVTDGELAEACVKKHGQKSEGLFLKTVPVRLVGLAAFESAKRDEPTKYGAAYYSADEFERLHPELVKELVKK